MLLCRPQTCGISKPWYYPFINSYSVRSRDQCLNVNWFLLLEKAMNRSNCDRKITGIFRPIVLQKTYNLLKYLKKNESNLIPQIMICPENMECFNSINYKRQGRAPNHFIKWFLLLALPFVKIPEDYCGSKFIIILYFLIVFDMISVFQ